MVNNLTKGENSPNLVTLLTVRAVFRVLRKKTKKKTHSKGSHRGSGSSGLNKAATLPVSFYIQQVVARRRGT
jgi:hypothetical protein